MDPPDATPEIVDNAQESRFEMRVGESVAFMMYRRHGQRLALIHTEVPEELRGRGVGDSLVGGVLEHARQEGVTVVPICPFVQAFLGKHPEYQSLTRAGGSPP